MGGSSNPYYFSPSSNKNENVAYDEVEEFLQSKLEEISEIDFSALEKHIKEILKKLETDTEIDIVDIHTGGSLSKDTYVNDLSDVDLLISFGKYSDSELAYKDNPSKVLDKLEELLRARFSKTDIDRGDRSISLNFSDNTTIQILPAFDYHSGYKVPKNDKEWIQSFPKRFKDDLIKSNKSCEDKLIPLVKFVKKLSDVHNIGLTSYHIENLALKSFEYYSDKYDYGKMIKHFFKDSIKKVLRPIIDNTGQTKYADTYLTNKSDRQAISNKLQSLSKKINECNSKDDWDVMFK